MIGIYKITTTNNNKVYIGSSDNVEKRLKAHFSKLRRNVHHSLYLQATYNKYGRKVFHTSIIEVLDDNKNKIEREQYWMDFYKSYNRKFGYNMSKTASCNTTGEVVIYQYDIEGNFIKRWESIKSAQDTLNLCSIGAALSNKVNHNLSGGFQWKRYKKDKIKSLLKLYCCYDLSGKFIKSFTLEDDIKRFFNLRLDVNLNLARAVKTNGLLCNHLWKIWDSYTFPNKIDAYKRKTNAKKILQLDQNNNIINKFNSLTEAANSIGVKPENLHRAVSSNNLKYRTCHGFIWKYL